MADGPGTPDGMPAAWQQRHRLDINNINHAEALVDFPILVVLKPVRVDYSKMQSAGQDLRFTSPGSDVQLPYEIELWDPMGTSYVWVKPQQIDASSDTDHIYLYYDNAFAADGQNSQAVWSNGYEAVYHLGETGDTFANSAAPINLGNNAGTVTAAGAIGAGRLFDGLATYIKLNDSAPMDIVQGVTGMTLTAWIHPLDLGSQQALISVGSGEVPCTNKSRAAVLTASGGNQDELLVLGRSLDSDPLVTRTTSGVNLAESTWSLMSTVIDVDFEHNDSGSNPYGRYITVVNDTEVTLGNTARFAATATALTQPVCGALGAQDDGSGDFFNGMIDEVRISGVDRSTIWLQAQYQSMQDNDYVRFGAAETVVERFGN
jgi:hypothetical protein